MPTLIQAAQDFDLACRAEGLSIETVKYYRYVLKPFSAQFGHHPIDDISTVSIRQYLADLREKKRRYQGSNRETEGGLSVETIRARVRGLRRFFAWCVAEYRLDPQSNPMLRIRMPASPKRYPKDYEVGDFLRLLAAININSISGIRDRAMLIFLADTGCRAGALLSLRAQNLNLIQRQATVLTKGDRQHTVRFLPQTGEVLRAWLNVRPTAAGEHVFCSLATDEHYGRPLTISGLNQAINRLKKRAGVKGRTNPHSFRHGFARGYLEQGGDLATLARILGHSDVSVTVQFYAVFTEGELADHHDRFTPLRRILESKHD